MCRVTIVRRVVDLVVGPEGHQFIRAELAHGDIPQDPSGASRPHGDQGKRQDAIIQPALS